MAINVKKFYHSAVWLTKRAEILKRDNNECQMCKAKGKYSKAECVHHIKFLLVRPDLALADDNLQSLCFIHHNEVHPEKLHKNSIKKRIISHERW